MSSQYPLDEIQALQRPNYIESEIRVGERIVEMEAGKNVKVEGGENNLIELIKKDEMFKPVWEHLDEILDAKKFIGRAPSQTVEFIENEIDPILEKHADLLGEKGDVRV